MRAKVYFFLLLPFFALHASDPSFCSKAFTLSSEAKKRTLQGDTEQAILLLEEALQDPSFRRLDHEMRFEIAMSLSRAYQKAKKFSKQEEFVKHLLNDRSYQSYKITLKSYLGSIYLVQEKIESSQAIMKELLRLPKRDLNTEDKNAIALLHNQIDDYIKSHFERGKACFLQGNYLEAEEAARKVHAMYSKHFVLSSKTRWIFLCHLEYSVACCQFLAKNYKYALITLQKRSSDLYLSSQELTKLYWYGNLLYALCYKYLGEKELSQTLLEEIQKTSPFPEIAKEALWQEAFLQPSLLKLLEASSDEELYFLARLTNNKELFGTLVKRYPHSYFAPESYFRLFSDVEYASKKQEAIHHLRSMPEKYQAPPFSTLRAYYLGIHDRSEKSLLTAISESRSKEPLASLYLDALFQMAKEFSSEQALTELLLFLSKNEKEIPKQWVEIWQKGLFLQATLFEKKGLAKEAQEKRKELLEVSQKQDLFCGDIIAQTLCLLAQDSTTAEESLRLLDIAENCPHIDREELLHIWLTRSQILIENKQFDTAHHFLSRVINDDLASSLRIQAMFLRADIYEMTKREDLAKKQLDFIIEKGGEWALLAQSRRNQL